MLWDSAGAGCGCPWVTNSCSDGWGGSSGGHHLVGDSRLVGVGGVGELWDALHGWATQRAAWELWGAACTPLCITVAPHLTHRSPAGTLRSLLAAEALPLRPAAVPQAGRPPGAAWALQAAGDLSAVCPCCDAALRPLRGEGEGCGAVGRGVFSGGGVPPRSCAGTAANYCCKCQFKRRLSLPPFVI